MTRGPKRIALAPHYAPATCCDRGYGHPSGRPRVSLVPRLSRGTLRRNEKIRFRSSLAVPRDGCPPARPSPRSCNGVSRIMRANPRLPDVAQGGNDLLPVENLPCHAGAVQDAQFGHEPTHKVAGSDVKTNIIAGFAVAAPHLFP